MDKTLIFSDLVTAVAKLTGATDADAENFLRETFALAAETLEADGTLTIPGLGTFVVTPDTVAYAPAEELAATVNAPFAAFSAVELPEGMGEEETELTESTELTEVAEEADAGEEIAAAAQFEETEDATPAAPEEPAKPAEPAAPAAPPIPPTPAPAPREEEEPGERRSFAWIAWLAACALCFCVGYWAGSRNEDTELTEETELTDAANSEAELTEVTELTEVAEPAPVEVAKPAVTDTISSTRFLTTMARRHYGATEFWVYIYEANREGLGHPDRLDGGTVLVIPPADSLGLDPADPAKIAEAQRLAAEIYARFN